jgi:hypothetical protein
MRFITHACFIISFKGELIINQQDYFSDCGSALFRRASFAITYALAKWLKLPYRCGAFVRSSNL